MPFRPDQTGLAQRFKMLGEGRLWNLAVAHLQESGAGLRAPRPGNFGENSHSGRVGQGM